MNTREFLETIKKNKIAIYGTGYVAMRFYDTLIKKNLTKNLVSFITTNGGSEINGYKVLSISDCRIDNILILIAVHEAVKDDIIKKLESLGYINYIWVYPFLYRLMLGEPVKSNIKVPIYKIVENYKDNYLLATRCLAIDQYFNKNDIGYEIYIKVISLFCSKETAEKRLRQFKKLIENWEQNGYDEKQTISILDNFQCFDGMHRLSLAVYFKQEYVVCDIYNNYKEIHELHNSNAILTNQSANRLNLENEIINLLEYKNKEIFSNGR